MTWNLTFEDQMKESPTTRPLKQLLAKVCIQAEIFAEETPVASHDGVVRKVCRSEVDDMLRRRESASADGSAWRRNEKTTPIRQAK